MSVYGMYRLSWLILSTSYNIQGECYRIAFAFKCENVFFFFQAEDGIRGAQESRGLGDVYKRQDEPTTGVDPITRQDFWQLLIQLVSEEKLGVILSTPYMDEASRSHRVGYLRQGRLVVEGNPRLLRNRLAGRIVEAAVQPLEAAISAAAADPGVEAVQRFGDRLHLRVGDVDVDDLCTRLSNSIHEAGGTIQSLQVVDALLEDVFIAMVEGDKL